MTSKRVRKKQGRASASTKAYALEQMRIGTDVSALAQRIGVHRSLLYHWQKQAQRGVGPGPHVIAQSPEQQHIARLQAQVAELEAAVGRKQVQVDFFQSALRRVEALPESGRGNGGKPSTAKSVRGRKAN